MGEFIRDQQTTALVERLPRAADDRTFHYITHGSGDSSPVFLGFMSDETYSEAISSIVVRCVDVLPYDAETGEILIATRSQEPQMGDWVFGGRKKAGNPDGAAAISNLKRELGLEINSDELLPTGYNFDMMWPTRQQSPYAVKDPALGEDGRFYTAVHQSTTLYVLPIHKDRIDLGKLNEEFGEARWIDPLEIINAEPGTYHPTLVDMVFATLDTVTQPNYSRDLEAALMRAHGQFDAIEAAVQDHELLYRIVRDQESRRRSREYRIRGLINMGFDTHEAEKIELAGDTYAFQGVSWALAATQPLSEDDQRTHERTFGYSPEPINPERLRIEIEKLEANQTIGDWTIMKILRDMNVATPNIMADNSPALRSILRTAGLVLAYDNRRSGEILDRMAANNNGGYYAFWSNSYNP